MNWERFFLKISELELFRPPFINGKASGYCFSFLEKPLTTVFEELSPFFHLHHSQMTLFWFLQHYCGPVECEKNRKVPFKVETKCVLLYCISQSLVAKNVKFLTIKKHFIFSQLPKMSTKTHQLIINTLYNLLGPYFQ